MLENTPFQQFVAPRIAKTIDRLKSSVWTYDDRLLAVSQTVSGPNYVDVASASRLRYRPVRRFPYTWGRMFDQCWWQLKLPAAKTRAQRYLSWDDQAEATVYVDGEPVGGIDPGHAHFPVPKGAGRLLIESTCCRTGVWVAENPTWMSIDGSVFRGAKLATRNDDAFHAYHDLKVLFDTLMLMHRPDYPANNKPANPGGYRPPFDWADPIFRQIMQRLNEAADVYDKHGAAALRKSLSKVYDSLHTDKRSHTVILTGHAHIDLVWLWPERVGEFKAVHSLSNAHALLERYPEVTFGYSQPASYRAVEQLSPGLHRRVTRAIRGRRWEATGALEVESDTQMPCGEALIRSFELGQRGFAQLNGKKNAASRVVWLPDSFGYSGNLPQLMAGFGVPYFFTTKLHWGSATKFPYSSFRWQGHDGSEVVAHIIRDHYNQTAEPEQLKKITAELPQSAVHDQTLIPTGYGDGGGGPNEDMAERARRIGRLGMLGEVAGVPDAKWGRIDEFFDRLNENREALPAWRGEMYLQYHRGVQTTHGDLKAAYRAAERALQVWEAVRCATGKGPIDERAWQRVVFAQFHDYLPGSSIWEVCRDAVKELTMLAKDVQKRASDELTTAKGSPCVFNPLPQEAYHADAKRVYKVPPLSGVEKAQLEPVEASAPKLTATGMSNERVKATFDRLGRVRSLTCDGIKLDLNGPGAQLWTFPDHPAMYDAWDIDRPTLSNGDPVRTTPKRHTENEGSLNAAVCYTRKVGRSSTITTRYRLDPVRPVMHIEFDIDWQEPQVLLKLAFPTGYKGKQARFGSAFNSALRDQLPGPLHTDAAFEAPASRWAAVSDDTEREGLMMIAEAKYGFGVHDGLMHISLLRSAKITEPVVGPPRRGGAVPEYSDLGRHRIRLAVGRFSADAPMPDQPAALADSLYTTPMTYTGKPVTAGLQELQAGNGLVPAWAKPLKDKRWVLRLHETLGRRGTCTLNASARASQTLDLRDQQIEVLKQARLEYKPYQLLSVGMQK